MAVTEIITLQTDASGAVTGIEQVTAEMQKLDQTTTKTEESTKSLKAQIREMTNELLNMAEDDPRRQKLIEQLGELKDKAADAADAVKGSTGPAFESMSNTFGIMTGQLANLDFGGLGQSLTQLGSAVGRINFKSLKEEIGGLAKGFTNLAYSLITNPYVLLGGAVAALGYVYKDKLLSPITDIIEKNSKFLQTIKFTAEEISAVAQEESKQIAVLTEVKLTLDNVNTSYEDRVKAINELKKINPTYFEGIDAENTKYDNLRIKINDYIKGLIAQSLIKASQARIEQESNKFLEDEIKRKDELTQKTAELSIKQAELAEKSKQVEESGKNIFGGKSYGAGYEQAKTTAAITGYSIQQIEQEIKLINDREFILKNSYENRIKDLLNFKNEQNQILEQLGIDLSVNASKTTKEINDKKTENRKEEIREEVEHIEKLESKKGEGLLKGEEQRKLIITQTLTDRHAYEQYLEEQNAKKLEAIKRQHLENYITITGNGLKALGDLVSAFNAKDEKRAKKQFQVMKSIQMASAIIDTYKAITGALADKTPIPYYMKVANAAIAGVTGFAQVAKIAQTTYDSKTVSGGGGIGGGGNDGGNNMPTAPAVDFGFLQQTGQPNTVETYVLAGNVANALEARQKIIDQSYL